MKSDFADELILLLSELKNPEQPSKEEWQTIVYRLYSHIQTNGTYIINPDVWTVDFS